MEQHELDELQKLINKYFSNKKITTIPRQKKGNKKSIYMQEVGVTTEVDAPIKFGIAQISNPTPKSVKNVFRWVLYAAALANLILQIVVEIPEPVRAIVAKYSLYAVTLTHGISKLFGVDISEIENPTFRRNQKSSI